MKLAIFKTDLTLEGSTLHRVGAPQPEPSPHISTLYAAMGTIIDDSWKLKFCTEKTNGKFLYTQCPALRSHHGDL